jgi:hypothetical protein
MHEDLFFTAGGTRAKVKTPTETNCLIQFGSTPTGSRNGWTFGRTGGGHNTYNPEETKEKQEHLTRKNELISRTRVKNWAYQPH